MCLQVVFYGLNLLMSVLYVSLKNVSTTLATHSDQEASLSENDREFLRLQKDIQDLGKKDLAVLKSDLDRIVKDAERLKASMKDDVSRAHGGVRLDINLEKARIKDEAVFDICSFGTNVSRIKNMYLGNSTANGCGCGGPRGQGNRDTSDSNGQYQVEHALQPCQVLCCGFYGLYS